MNECNFCKLQFVWEDTKKTGRIYNESKGLRNIHADHFYKLRSDIIRIICFVFIKICDNIIYFLWGNRVKKEAIRVGVYQVISKALKCLVVGPSLFF